MRLLPGALRAEQSHFRRRRRCRCGRRSTRSSRNIFKDYPAQSLKPIYIPAEPPQLGRREVHEEFATELTRLALAWHIPEITHPDVPALDLLSTILGDGRSSRLYRKVREEAGLAFGVSALFLHAG